MIYMSTQNNLQEVLRDVGTVSVDQLLRFFRNALDAKSLPRYIRTLVDYHIFGHDKNNNWLTFDCDSEQYMAVDDFMEEGNANE